MSRKVFFLLSAGYGRNGKQPIRLTPWILGKRCLLSLQGIRDAMKTRTGKIYYGDTGKAPWGIDPRGFFIHGRGLIRAFHESRRWSLFVAKTPIFWHVVWMCWLKTAMRPPRKPEKGRQRAWRYESTFGGENALKWARGAFYGNGRGQCVRSGEKWGGEKKKSSSSDGWANGDIWECPDKMMLYLYSAFICFRGFGDRAVTGVPVGSLLVFAEVFTTFCGKIYG